MSHTLCSQVNHVDSRLFMIGSQTGSLTPDPSFGHNLCFKCPNEQCEHILDIYVFKELFNDIKNVIRNWVLTPEIALWSFGNPQGLHFPEWELPWECEGLVPHTPSYSFTFSYSPRSMWCDSWASSWFTPLRPLCLDNEPKARVVTKFQLEKRTKFQWSKIKDFVINFERKNSIITNPTLLNVWGSSQRSRKSIGKGKGIGWKHYQKSQGCQGKSPFPRTTHDTCHFCVGS